MVLSEILLNNLNGLDLSEKQTINFWVSPNLKKVLELVKSKGYQADYLNKFSNNDLRKTHNYLNRLPKNELNVYCTEDNHFLSIKDRNYSLYIFSERVTNQDLKFFLDIDFKRNTTILFPIKIF